MIWHHSFWTTNPPSSHIHHLKHLNAASYVLGIVQIWWQHCKSSFGDSKHYSQRENYIKKLTGSSFLQLINIEHNNHPHHFQNHFYIPSYISHYILQQRHELKTQLIINSHNGGVVISVHNIQSTLETLNLYQHQ